MLEPSRKCLFIIPYSAASWVYSAVRVGNDFECWICRKVGYFRPTVTRPQPTCFRILYAGMLFRGPLGRENNTGPQLAVAAEDRR
jgi:hypothetical protein